VLLEGLRKPGSWPTYEVMDYPAVSPRAKTASHLPADARIGRVRLRVSDLGHALDFYRDVLGFRVEHDEGAVVALAPASAAESRELIILEERPGISRRPSRPITTGLYHVALLVPTRSELGRALLGLYQANYPLRGMSDHAVSESLYLEDPDGNGLEIYADRPRALWPVHSGEIRMTVDPLDLEGVIAAGRADGRPWTGLPGDTVIGHVHLTVSVMESAVAFYRDVVGFDVTMRIPSLTAVSAGGYHHHLNLNTWAGEGAARDSDQVAGLLGWELRVPETRERRALIERLGAAGVLTGSSVGVTASDPDGITMDIEGVA
jgi:catechol 2,3-dioxygenase